MNWWIVWFALWVLTANQVFAELHVVLKTLAGFSPAWGWPCLFQESENEIENHQ